MTRRMVVAVLLVSASVVTTGPTARADAVVDPARAIQRQLVPHHGVRLVERSRMYSFGKWSPVKPVRSVLEFGEGAIVASDTTNPHLGLRGIRNICIGEQGYERDVQPDPDEPLPPGKSWVSFDNDLCPAAHLVLKSGYIDLAHAATLNAVLATTTSRRPAGIYDGVRTTLYEGSVTFAQLAKAKPGLRISVRSKASEYGPWKVSWRLWVGSDQLVRRAWSSWREPNDSPDRTVIEGPYYAFVDDLRLSGWGMKVHITPPPADQTIPSDQVNE